MKAKTNSARKRTRKSVKLISLLLLVVSFVVTYLVVLAAVTPKQYDINIGEIASETIYAPNEIVDKAATAVLTEQAINSVAKVYKIDDDKVVNLYDGAAKFFTALDSIRLRADMFKTNNAGEKLSAKQWNDLLSETEKASLIEKSELPLSIEQLCVILEADASTLQTLKDATLNKLNSVLSAGLSETSKASVKESCLNEIKALSVISDELSTVSGIVFNNYLDTTLIEDTAATEIKKNEAATKVPNIVVKKGEIIVEAGQVVTANQYALLLDLNIISQDESTISTYIGLFLCVASTFVVFAAYLWLFRREVFLDLKKMLIITILIVITVLAMLLCKTLDPHMNPALIAIMLCSLLVCERTGLMLAFVVASIGGIILGGYGDELFNYNALMITVSTIIAGATTIFTLRKTHSRALLVAAGATGAVSACVIIAAMMIIKKATALEIIINVAWTMGSMMLSTLIVVGSLPVWENLFDIATSARLMELTNTNHPLLKQLMLEAPGTYQHSVMVATLAEAAAEKVGADPLLARVGGYFHDVGKLRRPIYFKENQKVGSENIHDTLKPLESAQIIISHQKDGVLLLTKYKLPNAVIKIAGEHHGNSLMQYFYYKAKKADENGEENVLEKNFRYAGNKPQSKESAIVMLADSCEAAVRSLGETSEENISEMVHKVIKGKMDENDNLLANAPLTFAEITEIEKSFLKTFSGIMHDRIEYPDMKEVKDDRSSLSN